MATSRREHGLGRLPAVDPRDKRFAMRAALPAAAAPPPSHRYWWAGEPLDQGPHPHCVGYAWRQFLHTAPLKTRTGPLAPAIYHAAQLVDEWEGTDYAGTSVRAGAKVLASLGHLAEYVWAFDIETVARFVLLRGAVVVGTVWTADMFRPRADGYVTPTGAEVGGHAWLIVGYSEPRRSFRALNSWGAGWGQRGRFWIGRDELADLLFDRWGEACSAVERKVGRWRP